MKNNKVRRIEVGYSEIYNETIEYYDNGYEVWISPNKYEVYNDNGELLYRGKYQRLMERALYYGEYIGNDYGEECF